LAGEAPPESQVEDLEYLAPDAELAKHRSAPEALQAVGCHSGGVAREGLDELEGVSAGLGQEPQHRECARAQVAGAEELEALWKELTDKLGSMIPLSGAGGGDDRHDRDVTIAAQSTLRPAEAEKEHYNSLDVAVPPKVEGHRRDHLDFLRCAHRVDGVGTDAASAPVGKVAGGDELLRKLRKRREKVDHGQERGGKPSETPRQGGEMEAERLEWTVDLKSGEKYNINHETKQVTLEILNPLPAPTQAAPPKAALSPSGCHFVGVPTTNVDPKLKGRLSLDSDARCADLRARRRDELANAISKGNTKRLAQVVMLAAENRRREVDVSRIRPAHLQLIPPSAGIEVYRSDCTSPVAESDENGQVDLTALFHPPVPEEVTLHLKSKHLVPKLDLRARHGDDAEFRCEFKLSLPHDRRFLEPIVVHDGTVVNLQFRYRDAWFEGAQVTGNWANEASGATGKLCDDLNGSTDGDGLLQVCVQGGVLADVVARQPETGAEVPFRHGLLLEPTEVHGCVYADAPTYAAAKEDSVIVDIETKEDANILYLGDRSYSMSTSLKRGTRFEIAKKQISELAFEQVGKGGRIAVGIWDDQHEMYNDAAPWVGTLDGCEDLRRWLEQKHPGGATYLEQALRGAFKTIQTRAGEPITDVYILTDGGFNDPGLKADQDVLQWWRRIREQYQSTTFHFTAIGDAPGYIQHLAAIGGGRYHENFV